MIDSDSVAHPHMFQYQPSIRSSPEATSTILRRPCGCDTFVAFPPATTSPNLIVFGKNSDRPTEEGQSIRKYPRTRHPKGADGTLAKVQCTYISIDQVETTHAVLLSQIDWMFGAEMGANEHGVVIGNEAIWTRDDCSSEPIHLLGMDLVRLGLERGDTARQALEVITTLLEKHGQGGACAEDDPSFTYHNSYLIVDQKEAWVLETSGRHWVAERITEGIRNISNCLTIRSNFELSSKGIEEYAIEQGYWKESDGDFDFAQAFSTCGSAQSEMSDPRFCGGKRLLKEHLTKGTMDKEAMISVLCDHPSGICMHGGGFETTSSWVSELYMNDDESSSIPPRHFVSGGPHPCKRDFFEEKIIQK
jgi:secernin